MLPRTLLILIIAALGALLVWLAFFWTPIPTRPLTQIQRHAQPPFGQTPAGGDFVLHSAAGKAGLTDYRGKVVLLYFGYTYCPDVCPTSLALMAQALSSLKPDELARTQGLFISLDPERDTPERLKEYAPFFHPSIIGLSGSTEEIAAVARQYGASYMKQKANADGHYTVDHSSITHVISAEGALVGNLPHGSSATQIVEAVRQQLASSPSRQ